MVSSEYDNAKHFLTRSTARHAYSGLTHTAQRCRSETEKNILKDIFSSVLSQSKNITPQETRNSII